MGEKYLKDEDFSDIKDRDYKSGVETLNLSSWEEFHLVVKKINEYKGFIWRGQRKDWQLKSTFDRHLCYNRLTLLDKNGEIREKILETLFNNFKEKLVELEKEVPRYNIIKRAFLTEDPENYIWATGQHYGLPTPILDWTEDPYRAAYFAFYKICKNKRCNRIVYALNIKTLKRLLNSKKQRFVEFPDLNEDVFDDELRNRIKKQKSKFTRALKGAGIEKNVLKFVKTRPETIEKEEIILAKIIIPDKFRCECLDYLKHKEEITYIILFPDYPGAVEVCKIDLGLDDLKGSPS